MCFRRQRTDRHRRTVKALEQPFNRLQRPQVESAALRDSVKGLSAATGRSFYQCSIFFVDTVITVLNSALQVVIIRVIGMVLTTVHELEQPPVSMRLRGFHASLASASLIGLQIVKCGTLESGSQHHENKDRRLNPPDRPLQTIGLPR